MILEIVGKSLLVWLVNEQRSFVDDLAFPRGCKFSSWLSSTRNWDLSWWMVLIFVFCSSFIVKFYRKDFITKRFVDQSTTSWWGKANPMTKIWDFQVPGNNLTFYPYCKVLVEMQFSYFWNSRNRFISKIGSTPGNTQIENIENSAYFWNSTNWKTEIIYEINGIPEIGIYVKIVRISGIPKISMSSRFLEFHLLVLLLQFEIV